MTGDAEGVSKNSLRTEMLAARLRLSGTEREAKSSEICGRLLETPEFKRARLVMTYMDFRGEAGTACIIDECFKTGKRVALPVVTKIEGTQSMLQAYEVCKGQSYVRNGFGICEPDPDFSNRVAEEEIDLVIVPGVVFDLLRNRIGYGAGYYDRFLPKLGPDCTKAGIAYDFQIVDRIPADRHDIRLDFVITERRRII